MKNKKVNYLLGAVFIPPLILLTIYFVMTMIFK